MVEALKRTAMLSGAIFMLIALHALAALAMRVTEQAPPPHKPRADTRQGG